jgi:alpha-L-fucosidase 2
MNKKLLTIVSLFAIFLCSCSAVKTKIKGDLVLWYDKPATDWYEALPIGNGTLGAMVYGGIVKEHLQLNENTLYSGEPGRNVKLDFTKSLAKIRQSISAGDMKAVNEIIAREYLGRAQDCYQPFGDLELEFDHSDKVLGFKRELDISTAVCRTSYVADQVRYEREVFASFPDKVIVLNIKGNKKGSISFKMKLSGAHPTAKTTAKDGMLIMKGQAPALALRRTIKNVQDWKQEWMYPEIFDYNGKVIPGREPVMYGEKLNGEGTIYEGRVGVELKGGNLTAEGDHLVVTGADEVKVILSGDTSFNGFDKSPSREGVNPSVEASANLKNALSKSYDVLLSNHLKDYQDLFNRVQINLGQQTEQGKLPTDKRLEAYSNGGDPSMAALAMQYARYLTIAASRPGGQPINLQGIWNNEIIPPWACGYTMNINSEIYYWMTEAANLGECTEPVLRFVKEMAVNGTKHVKESFGFPGWTAHHNTSIWRTTQPVDNANCSFWPMAGGWTCQQIWTHYQYSKDKEFLKHYYPELKGAAEFLSHWLVINQSGHYTTPVGSSPENRYKVDGQNYTTPFCEGAVMDLMITKELFANCIAAAEILGLKDQFIERIKNQKDSLQPYQIGTKGQLLEWDKEYAEAEPKHRHISHLYALCPGIEITKEKTPALFDATKRTLEIRGDEATGWSMSWKACCWARLKDGNHAYKIFNNLFVMGGRQKPGLLPNLLSSCPPFNIDGNFGAGAAVIEMLLQSQETKTINGEELQVIELLPALPDAWKNGNFNGLKARGGYTVNVKWSEGKISEAVITNQFPGKCLVKYSGKEQVLDFKKSGERIIL